jgi:hypothetical protein
MIAVMTIILRPAALAIAQQREEKVDQSVASALMFLAAQQADDGSFDGGPGGAPKIAMTGLSLLAFLSAGHTPDVGRHGLVVRRAADYLTNVAPADGYFGRVDGSRMYGQGIATLALAEVYGVEPDPQRRARMRAAVERAVGLILSAQDVEKQELHSGGWRYEPQSTDSDLSVAGWNLTALRAARGIGIQVPKSSIDAGIEYVLKCWRADQGGFAYQPQAEATAGMTGVAVTVLCLLDSPSRPELGAAGNLLARAAAAEQMRFSCYSIYYTARGAMELGDPIWSSVWTATRDKLLSRQRPEDGGWPVSRSGDEPGRIYSTGMAVLTLTIPMRLLPAYQR